MKNKIRLTLFLLVVMIWSAPAEPLHDAADRNDLSSIRRLLEAGANINSQKYQFPRTPLMCAAMEGNVDAARLLVDNGADIHVRNSFGYTALFMAASQGYSDIVKILLDHGANINVTCNSGGTPLMEAVCNRRIDTVRLLLEHGADVNIKGTDGGWKHKNARMCAEERGCSECVRLIETAARERAERAKALEAARVQAVREQIAQRIAQLENAPLGQLLGKQELDNGEVVEALTDAIITAKNNQLPDFLATPNSKQKVELLTAVEKQIARATASIDEANAEAGTAVSKGQDPAPFRKRAGQIKAYINVLKEIKTILEDS